MGVVESQSYLAKNMIVETLEIKGAENNGDNEHVEAESIDLIRSLGLEGQDAFVGSDQETGTDVVMPYRKATQQQREIIKLLFPEKTSVERYSEEPIPLEVLKVIALVRQSYSSEMPQLYICHVRGVDKDPILIGATGEYVSEYYLLAQWGDALDSWEDLLVKAEAVWKKMFLGKLAMIEAEVEAARSMAEKGAVSLSSTPSLHGVDLNLEPSIF